MTRVPPPLASSSSPLRDDAGRAGPAAATAEPQPAARTAALETAGAGPVDALDAHRPSRFEAAETWGKSALGAAGEGLGAIAARLVRRYPVAVAAVLIATAPLAHSAATGARLDHGPAPARVAVTAPARDVALDLHVSVDASARGAYFRKVVTGTSTANRGLFATGTLPSPTFDPARFHVSPHGLDEYRTGPLDRPSVYLGGRGGGHELDAGLTWDRVYDASGRATYTDRREGLSDGRDAAHRFVKLGQGETAKLIDGSGKVVAEGHDAVASAMKTLTPNFAFRPYFRTTNGGGNEWKQPAVGSAENVYFYPGEDFAMSVRVTKKNTVELAIRTADGSASYQTTIHQLGFGGAKGQSFKRVMSIDQFTVNAAGERTGLEGRDVLPTGTRSAGGRFDAVNVLVATKKGETRVPMRGARFTEVHGADTHPHYRALFHVSNTNALGGEQVDITP